MPRSATRQSATCPVLVTGATGFIGREVTRRLLGAGRSVVALARGRPGAPAAERVAAAVGVAPDGKRLGVVDADLSLPGCGLGEAEWRYLRQTVETVVHGAGETGFHPEEMSAFRAGHIDGPLHLLEGLGNGRLRCWASLSTAYVCGRRTGRVFEREGDVGQDFHNPYERVKLEAEMALRRAGGRLGVDVRIFRPSIVVGEAPPTAGGTPSNLFFDFIRLAARLAELAGGSDVRLRIEARPRARFNLVPVGYVAAAIVAVAEHPDGVRETFHLVVPDAPTHQEMLDLITGHLRLKGLSLVDPRGGLLRDPSPLELVVQRMLSGYREYLEQDVQFDDTTARSLLDRSGVARPTLSADVVRRLIDRALVTRLQNATWSDDKAGTHHEGQLASV